MEQKKIKKLERLKMAIRTYWNMDAEERQVIRKRTIDGAHNVDYWLALISKSAEFDHHADDVRPYLGNSAAVMLILMFFIGVFGSVFGFQEREFYFVAYISIFVAFLLFIFGTLSLIFYIYLKSKDIPNHLRLFIVPLLHVLREEVRDTQLVYLQADLRKKARKDNERHRERNYTSNVFTRYSWTLIPGSILFMFVLILTGYIDYIPIAFFAMFASIFVLAFTPMFGKYPKITTTLHDYAWLDLKTQMADGSRLLIQIQDDVAKYRITRKKRGRSGKTKIKTKTKYKIRTDFLVTLTLPGKRYDVEAITDITRNAQGIKMKHKPGEKRNALKVNFRWKTKNVNAVPDIKKFLGLIANAYKKAEPVDNQV